MMRPILIAAAAAIELLPVGAVAQDMDHSMPGMTMPMPAPAPMPSPSPAQAGAQSPAGDEHARHQPVQDSGTGPRPAPGKAMGDMPAPTMPAAYGEGSGTSRLPGNEGMHGLHFPAGAWMLMAHGYLWGAYTDQGGPRGSDMAFIESMAMLTAARDLGGARVKLQTMLSLEPLMGARGYPNLLATGETANGRPLIDRQHPHDLFMELSGRIDMDVVEGTSLFLYGGPVAEPALGPSAFMHRASATYLPLAPITHHWFDSTHITYGVVTTGIATRHVQLEGSAFRGREPDERRWDIEAPELDSWSVRASWTPSPDWALQISHGRLTDPEVLEPGRDEARTTASVQYTHRAVSATLAFSVKNKLPGRTLTAWLAEGNWDATAHHSLFGRFESVANDELFPDPASSLHDRVFRVSKAEAGYAYRFRLTGPVALAVGGTVAGYGLPAALKPAYGDYPFGFTLFARASLGH